MAKTKVTIRPVRKSDDDWTIVAEYPGTEPREITGFRGKSEKTGLFRFRHHPGKRDIGEGIVRISTADIRMHAGKPNLQQLFGPGRAARTTRLGVGFVLVPENRMESCAFVVDCERVPRSHDHLIELMVRQFQRPYPFTDAARHLVDRQAISSNCVPYTDNIRYCRGRSQDL